MVSHDVRYCVANENHIPFHAQPREGYTFEEAIARVKREIDECVKLFGGEPKDYTDSFSVLECEEYTEVLEARDAFLK